MAASEEVVDLGSLLEGGENAIVTLVAGETRLPVYRAVLASRSPVFKAMLQHDTREVTVADVEGPVLRQLVAYLYTLKAPEMPDMATQLLLTADKFGLPGLKAECELQVANQLTVENVLDTVALAKKHSCPTLTEAAISFIKGHTHRVMATKAWADAMFNQPAVVVELSQLIAQPSETRNLPREEKGRRLIEKAKEGPSYELWTLLNAGADVKATDGDKMTALHWAAERGHVQAVKCLVEHGADVNARNSWRSTPLHHAAQNGHVAVVQELLKEASADRNARGSQGWTPLHYAAMFGRIDAAIALLDGGAKKETIDDTGKTPLDHVKKNQQKLIELLT